MPEVSRNTGMIIIPDIKGMMSDSDPRDLERGGMQYVENMAREGYGYRMARPGHVARIYPGSANIDYWNKTRQTVSVVNGTLATHGSDGGQYFIAQQFDRSSTPNGVYAAEASSPQYANDWVLVYSGGSSPYAWRSGYKASYATTSAGETVMFNGIDRPGKWSGLMSSQYTTVESGVALGMDAPAAAPGVTASTSGNSRQGYYLCAYRYIDLAGNPSNLSDTVTVNATASGKSFAWSIGSTAANGGSSQSTGRVHKLQLFRTLVGSADVFYLVAEVALGTTSYSDTLSDTTLKTHEALLLLNPDGTLLANRFGIPPTNKNIVVWHQDRLWAAGATSYSDGTASISSGSSTVAGTSTSWNNQLIDWEMTFTGTATQTFVVDSVSTTSSMILNQSAASSLSGGYLLRPAAIERMRVYYSEQDEPEAWPQSQNYIDVQRDRRNSSDDGIKALISLGVSLFIATDRNLYGMSYARQPAVDANVTHRVSRGCFNQQCWDTIGDTVFLMDRYGCYSFDGSGANPISDPIQNFFRNGSIDFSKSASFFTKINQRTNTVRFYVVMVNATIPSRATYPMHALCYSYRNQEWWIESYPWELTAANTFREYGRDTYVIHPVGLPPLYDADDPSTGSAQYYASDYISSPSRLTVTAINSVTTGSSSSAVDASFSGRSFAAADVGLPIAFTSGIWAGQFGYVTSVTSSSRVVISMTTAAAGTSSQMVGKLAVAGGISWSIKTAMYDINLTAAAQADRCVWVSYEPTAASGNTMLIRHYLDNRTTAEAAVISQPEDNAANAAATAGDVNAVVNMYKNKNSAAESTGVARKNFSGHALRSLDSNRYLTVEIAGVSAEERHRVYNLTIEGAK